MKNLKEFVASTIDDGGAIINPSTGEIPTDNYIIVNEYNEQSFPLFGNYVVNEILISGAIKSYVKDSLVKDKFVVSFIRNKSLWLRTCDIHTHLV